MNRQSRLRSAKDLGWVSNYEGKNIIKGFSKWFGVNLITSVVELRLLGVHIDGAREAQVRASAESRAESRRRSREDQTEQQSFNDLYADFDDILEISDDFSPVRMLHDNTREYIDGDLPF